MKNRTYVNEFETLKEYQHWLDIMGDKVEIISVNISPKQFHAFALLARRRDIYTITYKMI